MEKSKESTIKDLEKYLLTRRKNMHFIRKRIEIQETPGYNRYAKSGGQWSERQYYQYNWDSLYDEAKKCITKLKELKV